MTGIRFFEILPHVKDRTFWKLWEFCVTSSLDRFSCFSINLKDKTLVFLFVTLTRGEGIAFGSVCLSVCLFVTCEKFFFFASNHKKLQQKKYNNFFSFIN